MCLRLCLCACVSAHLEFGPLLLVSFSGLFALPTIHNPMVSHVSRILKQKEIGKRLECTILMTAGVALVLDVTRLAQWMVIHTDWRATSSRH